MYWPPVLYTPLPSFLLPRIRASRVDARWDTRTVLASVILNPSAALRVNSVKNQVGRDAVELRPLN